MTFGPGPPGAGEHPDSDVVQHLPRLLREAEHLHGVTDISISYLSRRKDWLHTQTITKRNVLNNQGSLSKACTRLFALGCLVFKLAY
jgi:hypothetical protein